MAGYHVGAAYSSTRSRAEGRVADAKSSLCAVAASQPALFTQAQVSACCRRTLAPTDVIVCAAGSLPGDLHKLWRARDPKGYHLEYGYSCMGYEIAGGLGVKMAAPDRGVYVLVGDGSYLMMAQEIVTAVQERIAITIVLFDNHGFASIGGLSESVGSGGFGTRYRYRDAATGELDGALLPVDLAANAASLGARVSRADTADALRDALGRGPPPRRPVGHRRPGRRARRGCAGYESWWDVPVAEVSTMPDVQRARTAYDAGTAQGARFSVIRVANAPCSWGVLEFDAPVAPAPAAQVLDEMAAAGYVGTELGDWGFLPTEPGALAAALDRRQLALVGAFVPVAFSRREAVDRGIEEAVRVARLLASAGRDALVVLSDDNAAVANRTARAGRIGDEDGLRDFEWDEFAGAVSRTARAVRDAAGLRSVFHHHCAGYVETRHEIDALMSRTDPALVGLCLDTGHLAYGGGSPVEAIEAYAPRLWHVHFKDCDPNILRSARDESWDYHTAVGAGIFCELGRGMVPFPDVRDALLRHGYSGWIVVEQDVLPGTGTPFASAQRNRAFLRRVGL